MIEKFTLVSFKDFHEGEKELGKKGSVGFEGGEK